MSDENAHGRITARPINARSTQLKPGTHPLETGGRGGALYIPHALRPDVPAPLVIFFHGAGGDRRQGLDVLKAVADETGMVLMVPESRAPTWDLISRAYGPDVAALDRSLKRVFEQVRVDPRRIVAAGFSDGASYALSLGLENGDLFTRVAAFSPGFLLLDSPRGRPAIFISHGEGDAVLPNEACSRRLVPKLRHAGYDVAYVEFDGGHSVPPEIVARAVAWARSLNERQLEAPQP